MIGGMHYRAAGRTLERFRASRAFVRCIRGPLGSGKSTACVAEVIRGASLQTPDSAGIRHRRTAVVRNTMPELTTTTIKTWHAWVPSHAGEWRAQGPPTHMLKYPLVDGTRIEHEILFVALDAPEDVRKLLSMDLSDAWVNEARELPKAVIDGLTGRVGRYPPVWQGGAAHTNILLDTNSPDTDHWWYVLAERDATNDRGRQLLASVDRSEADLRRAGVLAADQSLFEFFSQPAGDGPDAENVENLPLGYYARLVAGKSEEWIRVYVQGNYGYLTDGKPVHPSYRDEVHCRPCEFQPHLPLIVGIDFGLTPAATICQRDVLARWRVLDEVVTEDTSTEQFADLLHGHIQSHWPRARAEFWGDPAGDVRAQTDKRTPLMILRAAGIPAAPAPSNDPVLRTGAVERALRRFDGGEMGFLIDPRCAVLRKALMGGYRYKRMAVSGEDRYQDRPVKDKFSHVAEALQYALLGGGEGRQMIEQPTDDDHDLDRFGFRREPQWDAVDHDDRSPFTGY